MADHIGVREVHDVHIGLVGIDRRGQGVRDRRLAHLGLQIVRGNFGAGDEASLLPRLGLLATAVEEERDMRILLGFGDMVLAQAGGGEHVGKHVIRERLGERDRRGDIRVVLGQAHERNLGPTSAIEPVKGIIDDGTRDLTGAIGAEVEENDGIPIDDAASIKRHGLDELIGDLGIVGCLHSGDGIVGCRKRGCAHDGLVGPGNTVPTLVAIHRVIATRNACHAHGVLETALGDEVLQLLHVALAARRRDVAAVHERMHAHIADAAFHGMFDKRIQVLVAGMHAAIGEQAHEMQCGTRRNSIVDHGIIADGAGAASHVDARELLMHHAAGADVEMPHLGVAHLTLRKAHGLSRGFELGVRAGFEQLVEHRSGCQRHGIARTCRRQAQTVHDNQTCWKGKLPADVFRRAHYRHAFTS